VRPCGVPPEAASKILIHYGNTERPDKLLKLHIVGRLDGHQNFSEQICLPNVNLRPLKVGPARSMPACRCRTRNQLSIETEKFFIPNTLDKGGGVVYTLYCVVVKSGVKWRFKSHVLRGA
jgi:hypothetical protein